MKLIYANALARALNCARIHRYHGYIKGEVEMMKIYNFCLSKLLK